MCVYVCVYVCVFMILYLSREIRGSGASSRPDDGRTSSGPDVATPLSCARRRRVVGDGGERPARACLPTTLAAGRPTIAPRAPTNAPLARQGWDQVQCVPMNLNQFDK